MQAFCKVFFVSLLLFQYFKGRFFAPQRGALGAAELRYLSASLEVQCDILTIKQEQLALCKLLLF